MRRKPSKPYLTIEETAATLRVSERTVRRWIAKGMIPSRRVARTVRIPATAVKPQVVERFRPRRGRPSRTRRSEEPDLAAWAMLGGSFDWLNDPREDGYTFEDGEPI